MDTLAQELFRLEPKLDLLHELLGLGRFAEVTMTSDGFFLGRLHGQPTFDHFLGQPSEVARQRTGRLFQGLKPGLQREVLRRLKQSGIDPRAIGINL